MLARDERHCGPGNFPVLQEIVCQPEIKNDAFDDLSGAVDPISSIRCVISPVLFNEAQTLLSRSKWIFRKTFEYLQQPKTEEIDT